MRVSAIGMLLAALTLSACDATDRALTGPGGKSQGRYAGIGTYGASRLWQEIAGVADPTGQAAAKLADDDQIIVVIDSHTGEVRQCGNHSGFCVTMNPWAASDARTGAPVKLKKHASDLDAEDNMATEPAEPIAKEAAPAAQR